jgi:hypothetical protein
MISTGVKQILVIKLLYVVTSVTPGWAHSLPSKHKEFSEAEKMHRDSERNRKAVQSHCGDGVVKRASEIQHLVSSAVEFLTAKFSFALGVLCLRTSRKRMHSLSRENLCVL